MSLVFEWDLRKARANLLKHSVSFAEATSVFSDPLARIFEDEYHSTDERREIILGHSRTARLLFGMLHGAGERPSSYHQRSPRHAQGVA